jgi:hypothetical protein
MIFKIGLLSAALVACVTPTVLAQSQQGTPQERAACAPDVRKFCSRPMMIRCAYWCVCRPTEEKLARLATRCWSATVNERARDS